MHSWLWRVYIYFTCSHDLLLFKFVAMCRSRRGKAGAKFFPFSENEAKKHRAKTCVCGDDDDGGTWSEEIQGFLHSFNIPAAGIFMKSPCY